MRLARKVAVILQPLWLQSVSVGLQPYSIFVVFIAEPYQFAYAEAVPPSQKNKSQNKKLLS
jgi:hypothetical protein